jgi:hypothetical protein
LAVLAAPLLEPEAVPVRRGFDRGYDGRGERRERHREASCGHGLSKTQSGRFTRSQAVRDLAADVVVVGAPIDKRIIPPSSREGGIDRLTARGTTVRPGPNGSRDWLRGKRAIVGFA